MMSLVTRGIGGRGSLVLRGYGGWLLHVIAPLRRLAQVLREGRIAAVGRE